MRLEEVDIKLVKENTKNKEILKNIRKKELLEIYSNADYLLTEKIVCNFLDDMENDLQEFFEYLKSKIRKLIKELEEKISLFSSTENVRKILNERKDIRFYSNGTMEKKNDKRRK
jgi:alpha-L-fucosidase